MNDKSKNPSRQDSEELLVTSSTSSSSINLEQISTLSERELSIAGTESVTVITTTPTTSTAISTNVCQIVTSSTGNNNNNIINTNFELCNNEDDENNSNIVRNINERNPDDKFIESTDTTNNMGGPSSNNDAETCILPTSSNYMEQTTEKSKNLLLMKSTDNSLESDNVNCSSAGGVIVGSLLAATTAKSSSTSSSASSLSLSPITVSKISAPTTRSKRKLLNSEAATAALVRNNSISLNSKLDIKNHLSSITTRKSAAISINSQLCYNNDMLINEDKPGSPSSNNNNINKLRIPCGSKHLIMSTKSSEEDDDDDDDDDGGGERGASENLEGGGNCGSGLGGSITNRNLRKNNFMNDNENDIININKEESQSIKDELKNTITKSTHYENEESNCNRNKHPATSSCDVDDKTSSSSTSTTTTSSANDSRKVEPLKINLHRDAIKTKITIKPIVKPSHVVENDNRSCSPIPKLTIKSTSSSNSNIITTGGSICNDSKVILNCVEQPQHNEPHILPKLTIRASDCNNSLTNSDVKHTVVPKLTIKMDSTMNCIRDSSLLESSSSPSPSPPPPPLPKLTIKTTGDTTESIISTISPKSSVSPSSSCHIVESNSNSSLSSASPTVPKLTIKTIPKLTATSSTSTSSSDMIQTIPKFTIKTLQSSPLISVCTSEASYCNTSDDDSSKVNNELEIIPKLTIKTIQEPVIVNQSMDLVNANQQTIPKLTIRTKSESIICNDSSDKIQTVPKFTIKSVQDNVQSIPKLTITTVIDSTSSTSIVGAQSPSLLTLEKIPKLTVRQMEQEDTEKVPKLMISLQDTEESYTEKFVPKLTIKQVSENDNITEKIPKLMIKHIQDVDDVEKCPKLTIKSIPELLETEKIVPKLMIRQVQQTDEVDKISKLQVHIQEPENSEKIPKLMIKQIPDTDDSVDKTLKLTIKTVQVCEDLKVPKLKIKQMPEYEIAEKLPKLTIKTVQESGSSGDKVTKLMVKSIQDPEDMEKIPKLTIRNIHDPEDSSKIPKLTISQIHLNEDNCDILERIAENDCEKTSPITIPRRTGRYSQKSEIANEKITKKIKIKPIVDCNSIHKTEDRQNAERSVAELHQAKTVSNDFHKSPLLDEQQFISTKLIIKPNDEFGKLVLAQRNEFYTDAKSLPKGSESNLNTESTNSLRNESCIVEIPSSSSSTSSLNCLLEENDLKCKEIDSDSNHFMICDNKIESTENDLTNSLVNSLLLESKKIEGNLITSELGTNPIFETVNVDQTSQDVETNFHNVPVSLDTALNTTNVLHIDLTTEPNSPETIENHSNNLDEKAVISTKINTNICEVSKPDPLDIVDLDTDDCILVPDDETNVLNISNDLPKNIENIASPLELENKKHEGIQIKNDAESENLITNIIMKLDKNRSNDLKRPFDSSDSSESEAPPLKKARCNLEDVTSSTIQNNVSSCSDSDVIIIESSDCPVASLSKKSRSDIIDMENLSLTDNECFQKVSQRKNRHVNTGGGKKIKETKVDLREILARMQKQQHHKQKQKQKQKQKFIDNTRTSQNYCKKNSNNNNKRSVGRKKSASLNSIKSAQNILLIHDQTESGNMIMADCESDPLGIYNNNALRKTRDRQNEIGSGLDITNSLKSESVPEVVKPMKRPRGRPRKDGQPAGSVKKPETTSKRKFQGVLMATHNLFVDQQVKVSVEAEESPEKLEIIPIVPILSPVPALESVPVSDPVPESVSVPVVPALVTTEVTPTEVPPIAEPPSTDFTNPPTTPPKIVSRRGRGGRLRGRGAPRNRPRCIGGLSHTPERPKEPIQFPADIRKLVEPKIPSIQLFEEDTRMSAESFTTPARQSELLNNDDTQSSILSTTSLLESNSATGVKKRIKMEVIALEGKMEYTVETIAEYDWPPPKGCCPARNRDTFMIQEQIAQYLGIKSFKRKYPDLPRRQIDMEERNYLQEKGLVTEKMCDLGITAVWASDVLDIMYSDFYDKYEEYKSYLRQKQVRDIEAKQKALAAEAVDKGLQARERALQSAAKWNCNFIKARKEDRRLCLDLQNLVINLPSAVGKKMSRPSETQTQQPSHYPIALVPGQYSENYRVYTSQELRQYPINTILDGTSFLNERLTSVKSENNSDSESSSSSDDSSISGSDSDSSTNSDSDSSISSDEEESPDTSTKCCVCLQPQNKNVNGYPEVFIRCSNCRKRIHPSCIEMPRRMVKRVRNYNWQCAECKSCIKCKRKQDESKMLYCEQCDRGYHIYCASIKTVPDGRWHCENCAICIRCGSNKPEGNVTPPPLLLQKSSRKKAKWTHEYRVDHITKLREHSSMLCVPCARLKIKSGCRRDKPD